MCYYLLEGRVVQVKEGVSTPFEDTRFQHRKDMAQADVNRLNKNLGLTPDDVETIVTSSMFPNSEAARDARLKYGPYDG
jgi:hypothetical protein